MCHGRARENTHSNSACRVSGDTGGGAGRWEGLAGTTLSCSLQCFASAMMRRESEWDVVSFYMQKGLL